MSVQLSTGACLASEEEAAWLSAPAFLRCSAVNTATLEEHILAFKLPPRILFHLGDMSESPPSLPSALPISSPLPVGWAGKMAPAACLLRTLVSSLPPQQESQPNLGRGHTITYACSLRLILEETRREHSTVYLLIHSLLLINLSQSTP